MLKLNNYYTLLILFITIFLTYSFNSFDKISTKLESILPNSAEKNLLLEFNKFTSNKKLYIAIEGVDDNSLLKIKQLERKLQKIDALKLEKLQKNIELERYKKRYFIYTNKLDKEKTTTLNITQKVEEIKKDLMNSSFFTIDKYDPLKIFKKEEIKQNIFMKKGHLAIKGYGYFSIFLIDNKINSLNQYEKLYDEIKNINIDKSIEIFSPIFYFVENSRIIKNDVNKIVILSTVFLLLLYAFILKNIRLLFNTVNTLISSILFALFINSLFFETISIFVLVFGISISTVAIDYMFHNYMHNYYTKKAFNKEVLFGMSTTLGAFFILSFISFDLIKQLCYFSIISLLFSYLQFTFVYNKITFKRDKHLNSSFKSLLNIKPLYIFIFSIILVVFSTYQINFDLNLKNLDVNNTKLQKTELFFNNLLKEKKTITILIKANSIDELIKNAKELKKTYPSSYIPISVLLDKKTFLEKQKELEKTNLETIVNTFYKDAVQKGFKKEFFKNSYIFEEELPSYDMAYLKGLNIDITKYKNQYLTYAILDKNKQKEYSKYPFIENLSIKILFENKLRALYKELEILGTISILFILLMLFIFTKKNYVLALTFVTFPLAITLGGSLFIPLNILHLFMIFIILAISIDYGIYISSKENIDIYTYKSIFYSLISTFAGFGVLIFSTISSLFSIGIIATLGILSILVLLLCIKRN